jgi:hypothetical protein
MRLKRGRYAIVALGAMVGLSGCPSNHVSLPTTATSPLPLLVSTTLPPPIPPTTSVDATTGECPSGYVADEAAAPPLVSGVTFCNRGGYIYVKASSIVVVDLYTTASRGDILNSLPAPAEDGVPTIERLVDTVVQAKTDPVGQHPYIVLYPEFGTYFHTQSGDSFIVRAAIDQLRTAEAATAQVLEEVALKRSEFAETANGLTECSNAVGSAIVNYYSTSNLPPSDAIGFALAGVLPSARACKSAYDAYTGAEAEAGLAGDDEQKAVSLFDETEKAIGSVGLDDVLNVIGEHLQLLVHA